jgi:hypothetical protein
MSYDGRCVTPLDGIKNLPASLEDARAVDEPEFNPHIALEALSFLDDGNLSRLSCA